MLDPEGFGEYRTIREEVVLHRLRRRIKGEQDHRNETALLRPLEAQKGSGN